MLNAINKRRGGFTLVEIMIVVAIIALLAAIGSIQRLTSTRSRPTEQPVPPSTSLIGRTT
ncbi:MAG: hypothetical protein DME28_09180 [Verrucomicrobia bacterium]|nr:MAG: hypothetical protein DME28_09180 [Verrucomicrobiota bacterium]